MKKLYWRPQRMSLRVMLLLALISVGGLAAVETFRTRERQPMYREKHAAARLARKAFSVIRKERLARQIAIDEESDPVDSGMIGTLITPVTTNTGHLSAKQTSVNPNFAAVVVHLLGKAGVNPGDTIAVGVSGSFPALNIAVFAAIESMKLRPLVISSVGSSQWGANHPRLMWPDMESVLFARNVFTTRSIALTPGGIDDRALGLSAGGRKSLDEVMARSGLPTLDVEHYDDSLNKRMVRYQEAAGDAEIRAYINVGGGTTSVGTSVGKRLFRPGLNRTLTRSDKQIDSVMARFILQGVPVIHLSSISRLAERYGLPLQPTVMPNIGDGKIFVLETYNIWLAAGILLLVLAMLIAFLRLDLGYRLFQTPSRGGEDVGTTPEPML